MRNLALPAILAAAFAVAGCFNEPEPAYKTVPAENRIWKNDQSLKEVPTGLNVNADYLNLDRNQITNAANVAALTKLKWLRLNSNQLNALPDLKALTLLRRIYLKNNRFATVPETLKDLPALTDIDLSANPITEIPEWLAKKQGLENLSFSRTMIKKLPSDISAWKSLKILQLGDLGLSREEMKRIREALPKTAVVY